MKKINHFLKNTGTSRALTPDEFMQKTHDVSKLAADTLAIGRKANKMKVIEKMTKTSAIPRRFINSNLYGGCHDVQKAAYSVGRDFVDTFDESLRSGAGLMLFGGIGTGKTHLACAIANALLAEFKLVMYCTVIEAVMMVKQSWSGSSELSEYEVYQQFAVPELLILDEVGVQHGSDFEVMVITSIIDARSRRCLPTIAISNYSPEKVIEIIGDRAFDRLMGFGGKVIEMRGDSLRQKVVYL